MDRMNHNKIMKSRKFQIISIAVIGAILISSVSYLIFHKDDNYSLSIEEIGQISAHGGTNALKIHNNVVYVADRGDTEPGGLILFDISNPETPTRIGSYYESGIYWDLDILLCNNSIIALIANSINGLEIVNVTDPNHLEKIGHYKPQSEVYDVKIKEDHAFICLWDEGLEILDLKNITNPTLVSHIDFTGACTYVYLDGDRLITTNHLSTYTSIFIYDISNVITPSLSGVYVDSQRDFWSPQSHGNYLFTGDHGGSGESLVLDISNLSNITVLKTYPFGLNNIFVNNSIAYITSYYSGLTALNFDAPTNMEIMGTFNDGGVGMDVVCAEDLIYLADREEGLEILKIGYN